MDNFLILNKNTEETLKQFITIANKNRGTVFKPDCEKLNQNDLQTLNQLGLIKSATGSYIFCADLTNKGRTYFNMKDIKLKNDRRINIKYQLLVRVICYLAGVLCGWLATVFF